VTDTTDADAKKANSITVCYPTARTLTMQPIPQNVRSAGFIPLQHFMPKDQLFGRGVTHADAH
jgi:hypothetical protein